MPQWLNSTRVFFKKKNFEQIDPEWVCGAKKKFLKELSLAYEVILQVHRLIHTLFIISTLLSDLTVEQFLMQPYPGCIMSSIKI